MKLIHKNGALTENDVLSCFKMFKVIDWQKELSWLMNVELKEIETFTERVLRKEKLKKINERLHKL